MTSALDEVATLVYEQSGIRLAQRQHGFLEAALERVQPGSDARVFLRRLSDPRQRPQLVARLIEEVTVKETSFLRDRQQLAKVDWKLLLQNARAHGGHNVRVWVAPCATGEEAYSLALLACEAFAPAPPPVSILATDISADALARARLGVYGSRPARELDRAMRERYFREEAAGLVVGEKLRSLVTFARHNLISDPFPPLGQAPFDVILCRNVLIYFDDETVGRVLKSFARALAEPGALVLGAADVLCASASRLAEAPAPGPVPAPEPRATQRPLRRPLGRLPTQTPGLMADDLLNAAAHFRSGLAELEAGDPAAAVNSLRRALYVEPRFGLAAFKLGGAHEALGELPAARRAYEQALRALEPDERHESLLAQVDLADVATATRARLDVLEASTG